MRSSIPLRELRSAVLRGSEPESARRWRLVRQILVGLGGLLILLVVLAACAEWTVRSEPVRGQVAEPSGFVTVRADERLFTIMAALNATGYDDENNPAGMHPVRVAVRKELAARSIPSRDRLRVQLLAHPSKYVQWVLCRSEFPGLERAVEGWWIEGVPPLLFWGLDGALREFYVQGDIAALWQQHRSAYAAEAARYEAQAGPAVRQVLDYMRVQNPPTDHVVVLPNLLDAYWRGYGPRVGNISYVVVGPADRPNLGEVQHEAMHPILNPLVDANLDAVTPAARDRLFSILRPRMPDSYPTWESILRESAIRAVEARLLEPASRAGYIAQQEQAGFLLVRPLAEHLPEYEQSDLPFAAYAGRWLESLNGVTLP